MTDKSKYSDAIAKILELDSKVNTDAWYLVDILGSITLMEDNIRFIDCWSPEPITQNRVRFIAEVPNMVKLIKAQHKVIELARNHFKIIRRYVDLAALEKIDKILEEEIGE